MWEGTDEGKGVYLSREGKTVPIRRSGALPKQIDGGMKESGLRGTRWPYSL